MRATHSLSGSAGQGGPLLHATPQSIAAARLAAAVERDDVDQQTGLRLQPDGQFPPLVILHCPTCLYAVGADSEGQAVRKVSAHIVKVHHAEQGK